MQYLKVANVATCIGSVVAIYSSQRLQAKDLIACHECRMKRLPKAKELPLYSSCQDQFTVEYVEETKTPLLSEISTVRKGVSGYLSYVSVFRNEVVHIYETGVAHSQSSYDYLINEENKIPRILMIASGGLFGYLFARKGGIMRKILYSSAGTGLFFTFFYPAISKEYFFAGLEYTKHHAGAALEKYGGYDAKKVKEETNAKVEYLKSMVKLEPMTDQLKEWFEKRKEAGAKILNSVTNTSTKDKDQGPDKSPDQDMYTTRTT